MAQDFTRHAVQATTSDATIFTSNSNDAVIGIRIANITTSAITVSVICFCRRFGYKIHSKRFKYSTSEFSRTYSRWCKICNAKF